MKHYIGRINEASFEPFPHPADPTASAGEFAWIKDDRAQFWRGTAETMPAVAPYPFLREEVVHVIEGAVEIELSNGKTVTLKEGDVGVFDEGLESTWSFTFPFTKLSVFPN